MCCIRRANLSGDCEFSIMSLELGSIVSPELKVGGHVSSHLGNLVIHRRGTVIRNSAAGSLERAGVAVSLACCQRNPCHRYLEITGDIPQVPK